MHKQQQEDNEATLKCFNTNERKTKPLLNDHQREDNEDKLKHQQEDNEDKLKHQREVRLGKTLFFANTAHNFLLFL